MKHYYLSLSVALLLAVSSSMAQTRTDTKIDTVEKPKTSLTLATLYSSNVSYYGQTSAEKLPYVLGYAALKFPTGLWLSGQTYKLLTAKPGISGLSLSAGYDFDLSTKWSGSLSYSRSFYPDSSQLLQSANTDMASAGLTYDGKWLTTGLTADYALGDTSALYASFKASKYIDLGLSLSPKDYFTLEPSVEVIGGTQRFQVPGQESGNGRGNSLPVLDPVFGTQKGKTPKNVTTTTFAILAYNFTLPLAYNRANYSLEASYQGSVLSSQADNTSQKLQSFFNLGFYYTF